MRIIFSIALMLSIITIFSCKKKVHEVNTDYIGAWSGSDSEFTYTIGVESNSRAEYKKYGGFSETTATGRARLDGDKFKIGLKGFDVTQHPKIDSSGLYTMTLDGVTYFRY